MVELLVEYRTLLNEKRDNGCTALMDACQRGDVEVVRALCEHGADVHVRDADGDAAMRYAEKATRASLPLVGTAAVAGSGPTSQILRMSDGPGCMRVLRECGARPGRFTRSEWYFTEDFDELPAEYVPAFH